MGEKMYLAEIYLRDWGRAIIDSEIKKLGLPDISSHERLNHVRGGNGNQDPTELENRMGKFMRERYEGVEWKVCSCLFGPRIVKNRYKDICQSTGWRETEVRRFENRVIKSVAMEVV